MKYLNDGDLVVMPKEDVESGDNAFAILGAFKAYAKQQGVDDNTVTSIISSAMSGDYENLVNVIKQNTHLV